METYINTILLAMLVAINIYSTFYKERNIVEVITKKDWPWMADYEALDELDREKK
jgi:hypothetical protein